MRTSYLLLALILLPSLGACESSPPATTEKNASADGADGSESERDGGNTKKRKKKSGAKSSGKCLKLVGGAATSQFPATTMLLAKTSATGYEFCSATFIGANALITAGHCIYAADPKTIRFVGTADMPSDKLAERYAAAADVPSEVITNGTGYVGAGIDTNNDAVRQRDLAVVIFGKTVAPAVMPLAAARPAIGDVVTMASYGSTTFMATSFVKGFQQTGTNAVGDLSAISTLIATTSASQTNTNVQDVLASSGDSGGPLLKDGAIAGVLSIQGLITTPTTFPMNLWVDLNSALSKDLIARAVTAGAKIGPLPPPPPPPANPDPPPPNDEPEDQGDADDPDEQDDSAADAEDEDAAAEDGGECEQE